MKNRDNENKLICTCEIYDGEKLVQISHIKKSNEAIKKAMILFAKKSGAYKKEISISAYQGTPSNGDGFNVTEKIYNSTFTYKYKFEGGLAIHIAHSYL